MFARMKAMELFTPTTLSSSLFWLGIFGLIVAIAGVVAIVIGLFGGYDKRLGKKRELALGIISSAMILAGVISMLFVMNQSKTAQQDNISDLQFWLKNQYGITATSSEARELWDKADKDESVAFRYRNNEINVVLVKQGDGYILNSIKSNKNTVPQKTKN